MSAPKGNKFAAKPAPDRSESFLHIRCTQRDKAGWVRASNRAGVGLSEWVVAALNERTENEVRTQ